MQVPDLVEAGGLVQGSPFSFMETWRLEFSCDMERNTQTPK